MKNVERKGLAISAAASEPKQAPAVARITLQSKQLPASSRYRLTGCIARGGMGTVYFGVQRGAAGFERPVAIKRTHEHLLGTPERRQLILQEARNAAAVRHPNVVGIEDVEEVEGELLLIMPYIDGSSLCHLLRGRRTSAAIIISVIRDACAGLHAIHTAVDPSGKPLHLLHRDISPQNILIGMDGMARIIDFGISKGAQDPTRTSKHDRRGKFGYMAPEYLARGISSPASDVFAMGVVLWEALAGRRLFHTETIPRSPKRDSRVPLLHPEDERVSPALDAVVQKALALSAADRFQTAAELSSALEEAMPDATASRYEVAAHIARLEHLRPSIAPPRAVFEVGAHRQDPRRDDTDPGSSVVDDAATPYFAASTTQLKAAVKTSSSSGRSSAPELGAVAVATPLSPMAPSGTRFIAKVAPGEAARSVSRPAGNVAPSVESGRPTPSPEVPNVAVVYSAARSHMLHVCVGLLLVVTAGLTYACVAAYADRKLGAARANESSDKEDSAGRTVMTSDERSNVEPGVRHGKR